MFYDNHKSNDESEYKSFNLEIFDVKKEKITSDDQSENDEEMGVFWGYMATEHKDLDNDIILPNAFDLTLENYKKQKKPVKLFYQHDTLFSKPIGIIPIDTISKEGKYWKVKGELNLDTQDGREIYSLMKQGALSDLSIGFFLKDFEETGSGIRKIKELGLKEVSVVNYPANRKATINEVKLLEEKASTSFKDLPLASRDKTWDSDAAMNRIRKFTDSEEKPSSTYKNAFFWFDSGNKEKFGSYKLPYADVVDGKLTAIPKGIFAAAAAMSGARGGVKLPDKDISAVKNHINKYYKKMNLDSPLKNKFEIEDVKNIKTKKEFEDILRESGVFSRRAALCLASSFSYKQSDSDCGYEDYEDYEENYDTEKNELVYKKLDELIHNIKQLRG